MGDKSKIEWTDATWNPWYDCHKVSPGCAYCYMDRWAKRSGRDAEKVTHAAGATFYAPLNWKEPRVIFTCSLSDVFVEEADPWRSEAWAVINQTPYHTYLILTKRPERIRECLPSGFKKPWPWPHVRLGISAENQLCLDRRAQELFKIPAAGYFFSFEPLLGPIDAVLWLNPLEHMSLDYWQKELGHKEFFPKELLVKAVIVGGESGGPPYRSLVERSCDCGHGWSFHKNNKRECRLCGPDAVRERGDQYVETVCDRYRQYNSGFVPKPQALEWVKSIRDQCKAAGVTFHFKQWGGPRPESGGRLLDGKEHGGYPI